MCGVGLSRGSDPHAGAHDGTLDAGFARRIDWALGLNRYVAAAIADGSLSHGMAVK